ncbi:MAG: hypothetical protein GXO75_16760 [Calditrichaeota bacterium]|nr:hypothetical protein [Calditrichota bacterium]
MEKNRAFEAVLGYFGIKVYALSDFQDIRHHYAILVYGNVTVMVRFNAMHLRPVDVVLVFRENSAPPQQVGGTIDKFSVAEDETWGFQRPRPRKYKLCYRTMLHQLC